MKNRRTGKSDGVDQKLLGDDIEEARKASDDWNSLETTSVSQVPSTSEWKPPKNVSYETLCLTNTELNSKVRPAGFRSNGRHRKVKNTSLISKIRTRCRIRKEQPKLAVCITMYNEDESELRTTMRGCLENYNALKPDKSCDFTKDDFLVVLICDGYDKIPESFK